VASGEYRNGDSFQGTFRQWHYLDGDLSKHCYTIVSYKSGRRHGPYSNWTVEGQKLAEGQFADGKRNGSWTWWDFDGSLLVTGKYRDGRPWSGSFASRVDNRWRVQNFEAGADVQLRELQKAAISELSRIVEDRTQYKSVRWHATLELARRKDSSSRPILIKCLSDEYHAVRGAAAWGLCQIGGDDAQDALLDYLRWSLQENRWGDLTRATEAQKELPDKRALPLLLRCLGGRGDHYGYVAQALGKLGDPSASKPLAKQLRANQDYTRSRDYLYLDAIKKTKGRDAAPHLVEYLQKHVARMKGQDLQELMALRTTIRGSKNRQTAYNFLIYRKTIAALEAISGEKSIGGKREDVAHFWADWLRAEYKAKAQKEQKSTANKQ